MKKKLVKVLSAFIIFFSVSSASAQIYVNVRPLAPVVVVTERPSREHVWVNEEWEPEGASYRYRGGYWEAPPQPGYRHYDGYWKEEPRGHVWHKGGWRK